MEIDIYTVYINRYRYIGYVRVYLHIYRLPLQYIFTENGYGKYPHVFYKRETENGNLILRSRTSGKSSMEACLHVACRYIKMLAYK